MGVEVCLTASTSFEVNAFSLTLSVPVCVELTGELHDIAAGGTSATGASFIGSFKGLQLDVTFEGPSVGDLIEDTCAMVEFMQKSSPYHKASTLAVGLFNSITGGCATNIMDCGSELTKASCEAATDLATDFTGLADALFSEEQSIQIMPQVEMFRFELENNRQQNTGQGKAVFPKIGGGGSSSPANTRAESAAGCNNIHYQWPSQMPQTAGICFDTLANAQQGQLTADSCQSWCAPTMGLCQKHCAYPEICTDCD